MVLSSTPRFTLKLRGFLYLLIAAVLMLLLTGISGLVWIAAQSPFVLATKSENPAAAMFVPKQSPVMVSLLVNPDRLRSFSLGTARPADRRRVRAEFDRLEQTILGKTGLNYDQDIKPWLGNEITFAVTAPDYDRNGENGQQPGYLLAIDSQNPERSRQFLQLFWQKRALDGIDLVFEQYAGVKIIYGREIAGNGVSSEAGKRQKQKNSRFDLNVDLSFATPSLATAVVGDRFLLFANQPKVLRDAINNVQAPSLSLTSAAAYQQALPVSEHQIGLTFVNLPQLAQWLDGEMPNSDRLYENLIVALQTDSLGLIANTTLLAASGQTLSDSKPQLSHPVDALQFVPSNSPLAAAGVNLQQFWNQLAEGAAGYGKLENLIEQFPSNLETRSGVERSKLFDWGQGEFAFALLPAEQQAAEWIFVAQKTNDSAKQIERLNAIAQQRGLSNGSLTLENQSVSVWTKLLTTTPNKEAIDLKTEVQGVQATVGNYEILATSIEAMAQALKASENSLTAGAAFQQTIAPLAKPNDGYLYVDWQTVKRLAAKQIPIVRLAEVAAKPLLGNVRSIAVTSYGSDRDAQRGAVFLRLAEP